MKIILFNFPAEELQTFCDQIILGKIKITHKPNTQISPATYTLVLEIVGKRTAIVFFPNANHYTQIEAGRQKLVWCLSCTMKIGIAFEDELGDGRDSCGTWKKVYGSANYSVVS